MLAVTILLVTTVALGHKKRKKPTILPVTTTESLTNEECIATTGDSSSSKKSKQVFRKSPKEASKALLEAKIDKTEYDMRYKAAFKEATSTLVAAAAAGTIPSEPVEGISERLNTKFGLVRRSCGKKQLARSTIYYQAAKDGLAGQSTKKRGPAPIIPDTLLKVQSTNADVCQVGDGKFTGRKDMQRIIGASKLGTKYYEHHQPLLG